MVLHGDALVRGPRNAHQAFVHEKANRTFAIRGAVRNLAFVAFSFRFVPACGDPVAINGGILSKPLFNLALQPIEAVDFQGLRE
jgi:hypothetical protein